MSALLWCVSTLLVSLQCSYSPPTFECRAFASLRFGERLERGRIHPSPCEGVRVGMGWAGQCVRLIAIVPATPSKSPPSQRGDLQCSRSPSTCAKPVSPPPSAFPLPLVKGQGLGWGGRVSAVAFLHQHPPLPASGEVAYPILYPSSKPETPVNTVKTHVPVAACPRAFMC